MSDCAEDSPKRLCQKDAARGRQVARLGRVHPVGLTDSLGLLTDRAILLHGICLSGHPRVSVGGDADMQRLVGSGAMVARCPSVLARDRIALGPFASCRANGVCFSRGTETYPADMVENIRFGRLLSLLTGRKPVATATDFYRAATPGRADALGRGDLGRLKRGAREDITIFDLSRCHGEATGPSAIKATAAAVSGGSDRAAVKALLLFG